MEEEGHYNGELAREMRRGCNKTTYKIIGCKVLSLWPRVASYKWERERQRKGAI